MIDLSFFAYSDFGRRLSRREFLLGLTSTALVGVLGCKERRYVRPGEYLDLGRAEDLLSLKQHVRERSILLQLDERGWYALSTRCTYDGCDLTYQEDTLYCSCCRSAFDFSGSVLRKPALENLPWYQLVYEGGHFFANSAKIVSKEQRYPLEKLKHLAPKIRASGTEAIVGKVPEVLTGHGDGEVGPMFKKYEPDNLDEIHSMPQADYDSKGDTITVDSSTTSTTLAIPIEQFENE